MIQHGCDNSFHLIKKRVELRKLWFENEIKAKVLFLSGFYLELTDRGIIFGFTQFLETKYVEHLLPRAPNLTTPIKSCCTTRGYILSTSQPPVYQHGLLGMSE